MRCKTFYYILIFLGILACLADSSPCMKNNAYASEYQSKNKSKKKGGKVKRCIKQVASHHEVHHHYGGDFKIKPYNQDAKPVKKTKDDKKKHNEDKKNKNDKDDKDNKERFHGKLPRIRPDIRLPSKHNPTAPKTLKFPWTPQPGWTTFSSNKNLDKYLPGPTRTSGLPKDRKKSSHEKRRVRGQVHGPPYPFSMDEVVAIKKVNVTIEQNGKDPIAINVIIRNNSDMNVTVMTRNSPVDKDAFRLGHFRVYVDDTMINFAPKREEYEWYHRPVGRLSRPSDSKKEYLEADLTHLRPNETVRQTILIPSGTKEENEQWMSMMKLAKKITVRVEGKWYAIGAWDKESRWSRDVDFKYVSNTIDLELPGASTPPRSCRGWA